MIWFLIITIAIIYLLYNFFPYMLRWFVKRKMDQFSQKVNEQMGKDKYSDRFSDYEEKSYTNKEEKKTKHSEQTRYTIYVPRNYRQKKVFSKNEGEYIHFKEIEEEDQRN